MLIYTELIDLCYCYSCLAVFTTLVWFPLVSGVQDFDHIHVHMVATCMCLIWSDLFWYIPHLLIKTLIKSQFHKLFTPWNDNSSVVMGAQGWCNIHCTRRPTCIITGWQNGGGSSTLVEFPLMWYKECVQTTCMPWSLTQHHCTEVVLARTRSKA